ncbi:Trm112 family protein [Azoarcus sp. L1K30]|uniref:Trm112 family protein n=1 Tax=Azoarcus sp. L1K30 TaxID=2820277 RepID=UPI001B82C549|nr:Trm112 family protein [Azoarcus sp. L1K30]MBR0564582.1 Trm112 family protein [Azoarcus sp. L1K30]
MDARLLEILVCPICKGPLDYLKDQQVLVCKADRLAYPIRDGIPVMLEDEARAMSAEEVDALR